MGFYYAVDWTETWILALLANHALLFAMAFLTRRVPAVQTAIFLVVLLAVACAERLNAVGNEHWREFATQNYFDPHGVFLAVVFCAPLLLAAFVIMLNALCMTSSLLVQVKKMEFRTKARIKSAKHD